MKKLSKKFVKNMNTVEQYSTCTCHCACTCSAYCAANWKTQYDTNKQRSAHQIFSTNGARIHS